jgi:hypothetical protein
MKITKAKLPYPEYSPKIDEMKNKLLVIKLTCCICQVKDIKTIILDCKHKICLDCLTAYVNTAIGDVSMFPVKCPMHCDGCTSIIDAKIAKRVLHPIQKYEKFIEFSDRVSYGEGMRCLFCNYFVIYPSKGIISMVECPHCLQRFCIKCKVPWHYGLSCTVENLDNDLEKWKKQSGAQTCPACSKLIEKDDPETCHHMVHKITDGIPCCRQRTDFCCKFIYTHTYTYILLCCVN